MLICTCGDTHDDHKLLSPIFPVLVCTRRGCHCTHFTNAAELARAARK